jgi:predicted nucleic acid-binding protein
VTSTLTSTPIVDANVWVAAFDATDRFHADSAAFLYALANLGIGARAPAILVLEVACALARRFGDASIGRETAAKLQEHPMLRLEPLGGRLLSEAMRVGTANRLRAADALYAATATMTRDGALVSWDLELIERAGAFTPPVWLSTQGIG